MDKKILHIDMDAYFASIEQRDNVELRGKAIAVGGAERRGVVCAASYEERAFGVRSAMAGFQAKKLCKDLIFVKPRFDVYSAESKKIMSIFRQYTELVEPMSLDEAYLDISEYCLKNDVSAYKTAKKIKSQIYDVTGLRASAGVSFNKFLAKIASDYKKPDGLFAIIPSKAPEFIDKLDIAKVPGIGKVTAKKMNELGIHTCFDIKKQDVSYIAEKFGKSGVYFYNLLHLKLESKVVPSRVRKSLGVERTFDDDISDLGLLYEKLYEICERLSNLLIKKNMSGKTITLKIRYKSFVLNSRSKTLMHYINDFDSIHFIAKELLSSLITPTEPVRLLGVSISNLISGENYSVSTQLSLNL